MITHHLELDRHAEVTKSPTLLLGRTVKILEAIIDAVIAYGSLTDEALAQIDSAIMHERPASDREGWNRSKSERLMRRRGWVTVQDIYQEAGIPEKHWPVIDRDLDGHSDEDIARYTSHPLRTVQLWIYNAHERLRRLDRGDLAERTG